MIIEKRKRIRINKPDELDWVPDLTTCEPSDWGDLALSESEITPWQTVLAVALSAWFIAYALASYVY